MKVITYFVSWSFPDHVVTMDDMTARVRYDNMVELKAISPHPLSLSTDDFKLNLNLTGSLVDLLGAFLFDAFHSVVDHPYLLLKG